MSHEYLLEKFANPRAIGRFLRGAQLPAAGATILGTAGAGLYFGGRGYKDYKEDRDYRSERDERQRLYEESLDQGYMNQDAFVEGRALMEQSRPRGTTRLSRYPQSSSDITYPGLAVGAKYIPGSYLHEEGGLHSLSSEDYFPELRERQSRNTHPPTRDVYSPNDFSKYTPNFASRPDLSREMQHERQSYLMGRYRRAADGSGRDPRDTYHELRY